MSRTDKTRPWWVQMVDAPGSTCLPLHDHRWGPCTLPPEIAPVRVLVRTRLRGCRWSGTSAYWVRRLESHGSREWAFMRREDRRRDRREARRALRDWNGDD